MTTRQQMMEGMDETCRECPECGAVTRILVEPDTGRHECGRCGSQRFALPDGELALPEQIWTRILQRRRTGTAAEQLLAVVREVNTYYEGRST